MSVIRRAMMRRRKRSSDVNIKRGIVTLSESVAYIDITHNLNAENYVFMLRRTAPIIRSNVCNGFFAIGRYIPARYSGQRDVYGATFESRTDRDYYIGSPANPTEFENLFMTNSIRVRCRNASYPFVAGEHEWVAIDLDGAADAEGMLVLNSDTTSVEVADNLALANKIGILTADNATLNVDCWNSSHITGSFYSDVLNNSVLQYISGMEARATYSDYTSMLNAAIKNDNTANAVIFKTRISLYPLKAGSYHYKIFKI